MSQGMWAIREIHVNNKPHFLRLVLDLFLLYVVATITHAYGVFIMTQSLSCHSFV